MRFTKTLCAGLLCLSLTGCTFSRVKSNHHFRELDTSTIQIGESTWRDVLTNFGTPSGSTAERIRGLDSMATFRYSCADNKTFSMFLAYLLVLPFRWGDHQTGYELVVEFDANGVVSDLYSVEEQAVWRPFQSPAEREVTFYREGVTP